LTVIIDTNRNAVNSCIRSSGDLGSARLIVSCVHKQVVRHKCVTVSCQFLPVLLQGCSPGSEHNYNLVMLTLFSFLESLVPSSVPCSKEAFQLQVTYPQVNRWPALRSRDLELTSRTSESYGHNPEGHGARMQQTLLEINGTASQFPHVA